MQSLFKTSATSNIDLSESAAGPDGPGSPKQKSHVDGELERIAQKHQLYMPLVEAIRSKFFFSSVVAVSRLIQAGVRRTHEQEPSSL